MHTRARRLAEQTGPASAVANRVERVTHHSRAAADALPAATPASLDATDRTPTRTTTTATTAMAKSTLLLALLVLVEVAVSWAAPGQQAAAGKKVSPE